MTQKPLSEVVVLDLTPYIGGTNTVPCCLVGGLGAEVIKIEPLGKSDQHRRFPPFWRSTECLLSATNCGQYWPDPFIEAVQLTLCDGVGLKRKAGVRL